MLDYKLEYDETCKMILQCPLKMNVTFNTEIEKISKDKEKNKKFPELLKMKYHVTISYNSI